MRRPVEEDKVPDHVASLQSAFGGYLEDHRLPSEKKKKPRAGGPKKVRASLESCPPPHSVRPFSCCMELGAGE